MGRKTFILFFGLLLINSNAICQKLGYVNTDFILSQMTEYQDALNEISSLALERKTGARALRSVIDEVMIDIMYDIPNKKNVKKCIISKDVVTRNAFPELVFYKKTA